MRVFKGHRIALLLAAILTTSSLMMAIPRPAHAWTDELLEMRKQCVLDMSAKFTSVKAELEQIDPAAWTPEQHCAYINTANWVIYAGLALYTHANNSLPGDLSLLAGTEYIPEWPGNPYNGWQPMQVLSTSDEFSPGDVVWQICPTSFYSGVRNPQPKSCELSVYGPTLEFGSAFSPAPLKANTWATVPQGSVYMLGQNYERTEVTKKKIEESK
jgi:hypothetical protein